MCTKSLCPTVTSLRFASSDGEPRALYDREYRRGWLNDFFFQHLCKYRESWKLPIHFVGGVPMASGCGQGTVQYYEFELGSILRKPMDGLIKFYQ